MNLKIRLIISYTFFAVMITLIFSAFLSVYLRQRHDTEIFQTAGSLSKQMVNNFEVMENSMEQVTQMLLSDEDAIREIRSLSVWMGEKEKPEAAIYESSAAVRKKINTAYNIDHYYRIIVYNRYGFVATSADGGDKVVDRTIDPMAFPWAGRTVGTKGRYVFLGIHADPWGKKERPEQVFSTIKELQGHHLGFVEVQVTEEQVEKLFSSAGSAKVLLLKDADVLYASEGADIQNYREYVNREGAIEKRKHPATGEEELVAVDYSPDLGIRLISAWKWEDIAVKDSGLFLLTMSMSGIFFLCSLCFIIVTAHLITAPLQKLRMQMERTELSSIYEPFEIRSSDRDIQALTASYRNLMDRLVKSVDMEKRLIMTHMQTQFDILQAQVNPHFLFNVLNVISNRGMRNDDETTCEICGNLAAMLRYSTSTKERYATLGQEIEYLKNYVYLMRSRFGDKIQMEISIEESLLEECVPKIFIQQMAENSLEHGYDKNAEKMYVAVRGRRTDTGWVICVEDRGKGMEAWQQAQLTGKIKEMHARLKNHVELLEAEIGGMGVVNVYGRMYLLYGEETVFEIRNREQGGGMAICIGVDRGE